MDPNTDFKARLAMYLRGEIPPVAAAPTPQAAPTAASSQPTPIVAAAPAAAKPPSPMPEPPQTNEAHQQQHPNSSSDEAVRRTPSTNMRQSIEAILNKADQQPQQLAYHCADHQQQQQQAAPSSSSPLSPMATREPSMNGLFNNNNTLTEAKATADTAANSGNATPMMSRMTPINQPLQVVAEPISLQHQGGIMEGYKQPTTTTSAPQPRVSALARPPRVLGSGIRLTPSSTTSTQPPQQSTATTPPPPSEAPHQTIPNPITTTNNNAALPQRSVSLSSALVANGGGEGSSAADNESFANCMQQQQAMDSSNTATPSTAPRKSTFGIPTLKPIAAIVSARARPQNEAEEGGHHQNRSPPPLHHHNATGMAYNPDADEEYQQRVFSDQAISAPTSDDEGPEGFGQQWRQHHNHRHAAASAANQGAPQQPTTSNTTGPHGDAATNGNNGPNDLMRMSSFVDDAHAHYTCSESRSEEATDADDSDYHGHGGGAEEQHRFVGGHDDDGGTTAGTTPSQTTPRVLAARARGATLPIHGLRADQQRRLQEMGAAIDGGVGSSPHAGVAATTDDMPNRFASSHPIVPPLAMRPLLSSIEPLRAVKVGAPATTTTTASAHNNSVAASDNTAAGANTVREGSLAASIMGLSGAHAYQQLTNPSIPPPPPLPPPPALTAAATLLLTTIDTYIREVDGVSTNTPQQGEGKGVDSAANKTTTAAAEDTPATKKQPFDHNMRHRQRNTTAANNASGKPTTTKASLAAAGRDPATPTIIDYLLDRQIQQMYEDAAHKQRIGEQHAEIRRYKEALKGITVSRGFTTETARAQQFHAMNNKLKAAMAAQEAARGGKSSRTAVSESVEALYGAGAAGDEYHTLADGSNAASNPLRWRGAAGTAAKAARAGGGGPASPTPAGRASSPRSAGVSTPSKSYGTAAGGGSLSARPTIAPTNTATAPIPSAYHDPRFPLLSTTHRKEVLKMYDQLHRGKDLLRVASFMIREAFVLGAATATAAQQSYEQQQQIRAFGNLSHAYTAFQQEMNAAKFDKDGIPIAIANAIGDLSNRAVQRRRERELFLKHYVNSAAAAERTAANTAANRRAAAAVGDSNDYEFGGDYTNDDDEGRTLASSPSVRRPMTAGGSASDASPIARQVYYPSASQPSAAAGYGDEDEAHQHNDGHRSPTEQELAQRYRRDQFIRKAIPTEAERALDAASRASYLKGAMQYLKSLDFGKWAADGGEGPLPAEDIVSARHADPFTAGDASPNPHQRGGSHPHHTNFSHSQPRGGSSPNNQNGHSDYGGNNEDGREALRQGLMAKPRRPRRDTAYPTRNQLVAASKTIDDDIDVMESASQAPSNHHAYSYSGVVGSSQYTVDGVGPGGGSRVVPSRRADSGSNPQLAHSDPRFTSSRSVGMVDSYDLGDSRSEGLEHDDDGDDDDFDDDASQDLRGFAASHRESGGGNTSPQGHPLTHRRRPSALKRGSSFGGTSPATKGKGAAVNTSMASTNAGGATTNNAAASNRSGSPDMPMRGLQRSKLIAEAICRSAHLDHPLARDEEMGRREKLRQLFVEAQMLQALAVPGRKLAASLPKEFIAAADHSNNVRAMSPVHEKNPYRFSPPAVQRYVPEFLGGVPTATKSYKSSNMANIERSRRERNKQLGLGGMSGGGDDDDGAASRMSRSLPTRRRLPSNGPAHINVFAGAASGIPVDMTGGNDGALARSSSVRFAKHTPLSNALEPANYGGGYDAGNSFADTSSSVITPPNTGRRRANTNGVSFADEHEPLVAAVPSVVVPSVGAIDDLDLNLLGGGSSAPADADVGMGGLIPATSFVTDGIEL